MPTTMRTVLAPSLAALLTLGGLVLPSCGGSSVGPSSSPLAADASAPSEDGATTADGASDAPTPDSGGIDAIARAVEPIVDAARAKEASTPALALAIYDEDDRRLYARAWGDFATDRRVALASASKLVSGLVLLRLVDAGVLSLDSTTGAVLGWQGDGATISLRHLLSFTSGLTPEAACTLQAGTTLASCVATIAATPLVAMPGERYDYGSTHLHVAARMAEVASGKPWAALFAEQVKTPLGLGAEVAYFTAPRQAAGQQNPLIAGGLRASMDEYAKILGAVFHGPKGKVPLSQGLVTSMGIEPYPAATIGNSPFANAGLPYHYGFTAWLECSTPATGCARISSPGAFGFTPWLDRQKRYYAILGMQLDSTSSGVVKFALDLEQALQPAIVGALGR